MLVLSRSLEQFLVIDVGSVRIRVGVCRVTGETVRLMIDAAADV